MKLPVRKYPRLRNFCYDAGGVFCVTICSKNKEKIFGSVVGGETPAIVLTPLGETVKGAIDRIPIAYPGANILNSVVMPNHVHILLQISHENPVSLFSVIRSTKGLVTKSWGMPVWQRSFYEHIVREEKDAMRYWQYIDENPQKWSQDPYWG